MRITSSRAVLIAAAAALLAGAPATQAKQSAARVEAQTRPNFGGLLEPPAPARKRHHHHGPSVQRPPVGRLPVAYVDCDHARPREMQRALDSLRPGGRLILKVGANACEGGLMVTKPVVISSDGAEDLTDPYGRYDRYNVRGDALSPEFPRLATIRARPGQPCITIIGAGEVMLTDIVLEAQEGGGEACVYARDSEVTLRRTAIKYAGQHHAVDAEGGRFTVRDTLIDASTAYAALAVKAAAFDMSRSVIDNAPIAVDLTPHSSEGARIHEVFLLAQPTGAAFGPPTSGIAVRGFGQTGQVDISRAVVCGFGTGLYVQGGNRVRFMDGQICNGAKGVVAAGGQTEVVGSVIGVTTVGLHVAGGHLTVTNNLFFGGPQRWVFREPGAADVSGGGNTFLSDSDFCELKERQIPRRGLRAGGTEVYYDGTPLGVCRRPPSNGVPRDAEQCKRFDRNPVNYTPYAPPLGRPSDRREDHGSASPDQRPGTGVIVSGPNAPRTRDRNRDRDSRD